MRTGDWFRLLSAGRFRIHPLRYGMTFLGSGCALFNSLGAGLQQAFLNRRILQTELVAPPIFIIGHWRSGTTLMHELLSLDQRWASPDNYDAFAPHHVLTSGRIFKGLVNWLLPAQRPMDNMRLRGRSPQEDDFALISLGAPTQYCDIAFCRERSQPGPFLALDDCSAAVQEQTRVALDYFYRVLTRLYGRRLILKSPPHTGRIALLAKWFPGARFLHLSRNPLELIPSTVKLWRALDQTQGFQIPRYDDRQLLDYIHASSRSLYGAYFRQRSSLQPGQLCEVRFEDLIAAPESTIERALAELQLDPAPGLLSAVAGYFGERKGYHPGRASPDPALAAEVRELWSSYLEAFGYGESGRRVTASPG